VSISRYCTALAIEIISLILQMKDHDYFDDPLVSGDFVSRSLTPLPAHT
jgi:hypothetical protein